MNKRLVFALLILLAAAHAERADRICPQRGFSVQAKDPAKRYQVCPAVPGSRHQAPVPPLLLLLNADNREVIAKRVLSGEAPEQAFLTPNDELALMYRGSREKKQTKPGKLEIADSKTLESVASIEFPEELSDTWTTDSAQRLYAVSSGKDDKDSAKARPGTLFIVDVAQRKIVGKSQLGLLPAGHGFDPRRNLWTILCGSRRHSGSGLLVTIAADDTVNRVPLADVPSGFIIDDRTFVLDRSGVNLMNEKLDGVEARIALPHAPADLVFLDSAKMYGLYEDSSAVHFLDFTTLQTPTEIVTGRAGVKVGRRILAGIGASIIMMGDGYGAQDPSHDLSSFLGAVVPKPAVAGMLSADKKIAYFRNNFSDDVTVVDTEKQAVLVHLSGGHAGMHLSAGGKRFLSWSESALYVYEVPGYKLLGKVAYRGDLKLCDTRDVAYVYSFPLLKRHDAKLRVIDLITAEFKDLEQDAPEDQVCPVSTASR